MAEAPRCVVVLGQSLLPGGAVPPTLASRVAHAAAIHAAAPPGGCLLLVSGADVAGAGEAEGTVMARLLQELGVPADAIWVDTDARSTVENAVYTLRHISDHVHPRLTTTPDFIDGDASPPPIEITLVTSEFHSPRAACVFEMVLAHQLGASRPGQFRIAPAPAPDCLPLAMPRGGRVANINELPSLERAWHELELLEGGAQAAMLAACGVPASAERLAGAAAAVRARIATLAAAAAR